VLPRFPLITISPLAGLGQAPASQRGPLTLGTPPTTRRYARVLVPGASHVPRTHPARRPMVRAHGLAPWAMASRAADAIGTRGLVAGATCVYVSQRENIGGPERTSSLVSARCAGIKSTPLCNNGGPFVQWKERRIFLVWFAESYFNGLRITFCILSCVF